MTSAPTKGPGHEAGVSQPDRVPADVVAARVEADYGLIGFVVHPLGGEVDQNMKLEHPDGRRYFARLTEGAPDSPDVMWQNTFLQHLAETAPDLPVPRLVATKDGSSQSTLTWRSQTFVLRLMSWVPGSNLAEIEHHPRELLRELGQVAGRMSAALSSLPGPSGLATHDWDMRSAQTVVAQGLHAVQEPDSVRDVETVMEWFANLEKTIDDLPRSVVHQDLNDANVLAVRDSTGVLHISGIVDVGDSMLGIRASEVAIAAGYAMLRKSDPLAAAAEVVAGFHESQPLSEAEIAAVFPLAAARLCMNAVTWNQRVGASGSEYGRKRMQHTWPTLRAVAHINPDLAEAVFRLACGLPPVAVHVALEQEIAAAGCAPTGVGELVEVDLTPEADLFDEIDWTVPDAVRGALDDLLDGRRINGYVPHLSAIMMRAQQRASGNREPATIQLGARLLTSPGAAVSNPLGGVVDDLRDGAVLIRYEVGGDTFLAWWRDVEPRVDLGQRVEAGDTIGTAADHDDLSPFGPSVLVQLLRDTGRPVEMPPRHVSPSRALAWSMVALDPRSFLGGPAALTDRPSVTEVLAAREAHLASSQRNYYREPMNLVRGRGVWFYDENGMAYLDSLNNVTHVGHSEPRVTKAASKQLSKLNTNSRFVYRQMSSYAERLTSTLPHPLEVVFLVCSGSEANDLALRIARQVTGREAVVNIDGAYHGNTGVVTGISPNRYKGPGGRGAPPTTHEVVIPDRYRSLYGYDDPSAGTKYARDAAAVIDRIVREGMPPAAFIAESLMGTAGNIVFPDGYLEGAFAAARRRGALCISDEVQVGVGRLGPWWGFELQGVVPDIVTMGKPLGNGHPLAAVVTTREIADAFDTGMKYFNTFGGNPVSCAIGEAVLDIVQEDDLRENATRVGRYFRDSLVELQGRHPIIGDVRAAGLYLGVELVRDRGTKEPATSEAFAVTELAKERGVIVFPNGVRDNVLKIKPPMTFTPHHVDLYVETLDEIFNLPELALPAGNR